MAEPRAQANFLRRFVYGSIISLTGLISGTNFGNQTNHSGTNVQITLGGDGKHFKITDKSKAARKRKKPRTDSEPDNLQPKKQKLIDSAQELNDLSSTLRLASKKLIMDVVDWLKTTKFFSFSEFYVDLQLELTTKDNTSCPIEFCELFKPVGGVKPTRILIESKAGYGKTTSSDKIRYDWANGEQYLKQFDLAFRIRLRDLKEKSLEEELQLIVKYYNDSKPIKFDKSTQEKTLLILDGYDELREESRKEIIEILYHQKFVHMTVVVTCRSGLFPLKENSFQQLLPPHVGKLDPEFYDKKVTILGVKEEKRSEFVFRLFYQNEYPGEVIADIAKWPNKVTVMLRSPLLLFLVCYFNATKLKLAERNVEYTVTDLYQSLINNIVRTNLTRDGKELDNAFNLFRSIIFQNNFHSEICKRCRIVLKQFGRKCFDNLMEDCYRFEPSPLMDEVYSLGLLVKYKVVKGLYAKKRIMKAIISHSLNFLLRSLFFHCQVGIVCIGRNCHVYWKDGEVFQWFMSFSKTCSVVMALDFSIV